MPAQRPQKAERKDVRCGGKAARAYKENEMRVISGTARGTRLAALPGEEITRPTVDRVKEGMFSAVQFLLGGARVLDLFAGSGQLGIEALSRGAARCVFIDSSREACAVVRQNLKAAGLFEKASVAETAAEMYLAACRERFDLVLLDPPYRQGTVAALLPAVAAVTAPGGTVLAETEHGASLPERCGTLTLKKQYKYGTVALARYEADAEF